MDNPPIQQLNEPPRTYIGEEERLSLNAALEKIQAGVLTNDAVIRSFEEEYATTLQARHVIATNSATSSLQVILEAAGLQPGQEVIVPCYTFAATAHAIVAAGGRPVFGDIHPDTLCLDVADVERKITGKTFGVIVVHIGGKAANMTALLDVCRVRKIHLFEDAAQAHGSSWHGRQVGTFGLAGALSFGTKLLSAFRGGAIITNDDDMAATCRSYIYHGLSRDRNSPYTHTYPGYNFQMTALQAALLEPQLRKLQSRFSLRKENGDYLRQQLSGISGLKVATPENGGTSNYYMFEIVYESELFSGASKEEMVRKLQAKGLPVLDANVIASPIYASPSLAPYFTNPCPVAEHVYGRLLVLGHFLKSTLMEADRKTLDKVVEAFRSIQAGA